MKTKVRYCLVLSTNESFGQWSAGNTSAGEAGHFPELDSFIFTVGWGWGWGGFTDINRTYKGHFGSSVFWVCSCF